MDQQRVALQPSNVGAAIVSFVKKPKVASFIAIWGVGVYLCLWAAAPVAVTPELEIAYEAKFQESNQIPGYDDALAELQELQYEMSERKVWFWRFRSPYSELVAELQPSLDEAEGEFRHLENERQRLLREANGIVGIWSDWGVADARKTFWDAYDGGVRFAKARTFFDVLFSFGRRDDGILSLVLNIAFNFTIGLISTVFVFAWRLWGLIVAYETSLVSGLLFFGVALLAAAAMVFTYIFLIYGAIAGAGYFIVTQSMNARLGDRSSRYRQTLPQRPVYRQQQQHPHAH